MFSEALELTSEDLKRLFSYSQETGLLSRLTTENNNNGHKDAIAGGITKKGYRTIGIDGKRYLAHILVWLYVKGTWPKNKIVHHKDEDKLNNRIENLQLMTNSEHIRYHAQKKRQQGIQKKRKI